MPTPLSPEQTVLAVDPGNFATAYVLLRGDKKVLSFDKVDNDTFRERLLNMCNAENCGNFRPPTIVATEMVASYGMSVGASVFDTCVFIGECKEIARGYVPWVQVVRLEVKLAICRSPKANDATIRAALLDEFGPQGTKKAPGPTFGFKADMWAALALAETVRRGEYRPYVPVHERDKLINVLTTKTIS